MVKRGEFRVRGDVFEICPASGDDVNYRIEIENQKIKSIQIVDSLERKIKEEPKDIIIFPPKHFISSEPQMKEALKNIKDELKERLAYFKKKGVSAGRRKAGKKDPRYDLEMLKTLGYCHGVEKYSQAFDRQTGGRTAGHAAGLFPKNFLTIIDESHIAAPQIRECMKETKKEKESLGGIWLAVAFGSDNRPLRFEEFEKFTGQTVFTSATPGKRELEISEQVAEQVIRPTGLIDPPIEVRPVLR